MQCVCVGSEEGELEKEEGEDGEGGDDKGDSQTLQAKRLAVAAKIKGSVNE